MCFHKSLCYTEAKTDRAVCDMKKEIDIIIFSGQSNMQGQAEALTDTTVVAGAYEYRFFKDEMVPLKNPVGENIRPDGTEGEALVEGMDLASWLETHVAGSAWCGHTNLVPRFCNAYVRESGRQVLAVHMAKGSTEVAQWSPDTDAYGVLVKKVRAAITKAQESYTVGHIYLAWLQGESDALFSHTKAYYKEKLSEIADALAADVGLEKFGIIRVGYYCNDARDEEIIQAQDELCAENDRFLMLTTIAGQLCAQPEYMHPTIEAHYSATGLEKLGEAGGTTLGRFVTR